MGHSGLFLAARRVSGCPVRWACAVVPRPAACLHNALLERPSLHLERGSPPLCFPSLSSIADHLIQSINTIIYFMRFVFCSPCLPFILPFSWLLNKICSLKPPADILSWPLSVVGNINLNCSVSCHLKPETLDDRGLQARLGLNRKFRHE